MLNTNTRWWLISLGSVFVLAIGGIAITSISGKLLATDAAQVPSPVQADASNSNKNTVNTQGTQTPQTAQAAADSEVKKIDQVASNPNLYCPKQSELFKQDMFWYGPNAWRDYSPSFVNHINNFAGAQWVGVNVGKVICLYKGVEENNFPVAIERDNLMKKPEGEYWKTDSTGYQICKSENVSDCPFIAQEVKSNENVYDFLQDIKKAK